VTPLARVVSGVAFVGGLAATLVAVFAPRAGLVGPVFELDWLDGATAAVVLTALTCVAELVAVRLRHADAVEELTLLDPMVLLNVLLLPPRQAVIVSLSGLGLAYAIRRRALVKAAFNIGTYAAASALLIVLLRGTAGDLSDFDLQLVAAMVLGTAGFVAVNLTAMSLLFAAMRAGRPLELMREDLRSSAFTLVATVALTATTVSMAAHTPALLPFAVLPAAAITYAYRSTAMEAEERRRSSRVLSFSEVLAASPTREVAVAAFLNVAREGFFADDVLAIFGSGPVLALSGDAADPELLLVSAEHSRLYELAGKAAVLRGEDLPEGWTSAMIAPLEADGVRVGAVVVGTRGATRVSPRDLTLLTSVASALAGALSGAEHLAKLVQETSKLRAVVDQSSEGILVLDGDGVVQLWNPAMERLCGRSEADALGTGLGTLLQTHDLDGNPVDAFGEGRRRLTPETPRATVDLQLIRPDGEQRTVRCAHAATFLDGYLVRDVVNVHDLTRERQVERLKTDFVATVSHELRTPVTPIKGYADLLLRKGDTMPPEKRAKALAVIADRAAHLARLVEDLLLASNVSSENEPERSVVIKTADLVELTKRAVEDFTGAAGRLTVRHPDSAVQVACDSVRTVQVLTNLVSNALKYSPEGSGVDIVVEAGDGGPDRMARVRVIDHGRGLPADQLERIFEKFHRVEDPMVMSTSGTGLGLYIARHLARAMQGDLTVTSSLGEGSEFTFHLPLATP
jgi:PAS domain S-box-containing protein